MNVNALAAIIASLRHLGDRSFQERAWIRGEGPEISSYDELICQLFDDTALGDMLKAGTAAHELGAEATDALMVLDGLLEALPKNPAPAVLLSMPAWEEVMRVATRAADLLERRPTVSLSETRPWIDGDAMTGADRLVILDNAVEWVREHKDVFFQRGEVTGVDLVGVIMHDVVELGRSVCIIQEIDGWWTISSDVDWLIDDKGTTKELFRRIVATPQRGPNTMRGEIFATAFARCVSIFSAVEAVCLQGDEPPAHVRAHVAQYVRTISFKM